MFENKIFEPVEATKVLPLITSIMRDVMTTHSSLEQLIEEYERNNAIQTTSVIFDDNINAAVDQLQTYVEEVEKYGGMVRNTKLGTVDFAGVVNSELVWFCWNVGEPEVAHFHGLRDTCCSRKSIVGIPSLSSI